MSGQARHGCWPALSPGHVNRGTGGPPQGGPFLCARHGRTMDGVVFIARVAGTPHGGPLSPVLAHVQLQEVARQRERPGPRLARYAPNLNVFSTVRRTYGAEECSHRY